MLPARIELATFRLWDWRSTNWAKGAVMIHTTTTMYPSSHDRNAITFTISKPDLLATTTTWFCASLPPLLPPHLSLIHQLSSHAQMNGTFYLRSWMLPRTLSWLQRYTYVAYIPTLRTTSLMDNHSAHTSCDIVCSKCWRMRCKIRIMYMTLCYLPSDIWTRLKLALRTWTHSNRKCRM